MTQRGSPAVLRAAIAALFVAVLAACGPKPDYVLLNRTQDTVAIAPGVILAPCSAASYSTPQLEAAGAELVKYHMDDDRSWIPAGAVVVEIAPAAPVDGPRPVTVLISSTEGPRVVYGEVAETDLPECSGSPAG